MYLINKNIIFVIWKVILKKQLNKLKSILKN
nr:MAG TPA: hypothetical protein [Caudoviricetes sp.]